MANDIIVHEVSAANSDRVTGTRCDSKLAMDVVIIKDNSETGTAAVTRTIFNETIAAPNVEQSLVLPTDTIDYLVKTRGLHELKLSWTVTESGTKYFTITKSGVFKDEHAASGLTLYFQSPSAGAIVEVITKSLL